MDRDSDDTIPDYRPSFVDSQAEHEEGPDGLAVRYFILFHPHIPNTVNIMYEHLIRGPTYDFLNMMGSNRSARVETATHIIWERVTWPNQNCVTWTTEVDDQLLTLYVDMYPENKRIMIYWTYGEDPTHYMYDFNIEYQRNNITRNFRFIRGVLSCVPS